MKVSIIIILFASLLISCDNKVNNLDTCSNLLDNNKTEDCFKCTQKYLQQKPNDWDGMKMYAKCAQSKKELDEVELHLKDQFEFYEKNIEFFILMGDVSMRLKEYHRAYTAFTIGRQFDSTYNGINYMLALSAYNWWKDRMNNSDDEKNPKREAKELEEILYLSQMELANYPNNTDANVLQSAIRIKLDSVINIVK